MKKLITTSIVAVALLSTSAMAEKKADVAKKDAVKETVIGTVNGHKITQVEANKVLELMTKKGEKALTFDKLDKKQKDAIVKNLAPGVLIKNKAQAEVSEEEKSQIVANYWMQKKMADMKATDKEAKEIYTKNKKFYKKDKKQLKFEDVKDYIKMQIKQKKLVDSVMKKAKVVVK